MASDDGAALEGLEARFPNHDRILVQRPSEEGRQINKHIADAPIIHLLHPLAADLLLGGVVVAAEGTGMVHERDLRGAAGAEDGADGLPVGLGHGGGAEYEDEGQKERRRENRISSSSDSYFCHCSNTNGRGEQGPNNRKLVQWFRMLENLQWDIEDNDECVVVKSAYALYLENGVGSRKKEERYAAITNEIDNATKVNAREKPIYHLKRRTNKT
nr:hypothetical protein Iba_chr08bCG4290 [Ipomoea batatas]